MVDQVFTQVGWYLDWAGKNWTTIVAAFYIADKVVKATPWPQDDFVVDVLWKGLTRIVSRKNGTK